MPAKFVLKKGPTGKFRFNLLGTNGQVVASSESYETKSSAMKGIASVQRIAAGAVVVDETAGKNGAAPAKAGAAKKAPAKAAATKAPAAQAPAAKAAAAKAPAAKAAPAAKKAPAAKAPAKKATPAKKAVPPAPVMSEADREKRVARSRAAAADAAT